MAVAMMLLIPLLRIQMGFKDVATATVPHDGIQMISFFISILPWKHNN